MVLNLCVLPMRPFLSNSKMDKSMIFIFISRIPLDQGTYSSSLEESSLAFLSAAIYSSLVALRETLVFFLQHAGVLFLFVALSTQSESSYFYRNIVCSFEYMIPYSILPFRYHTTCISTTM